MVRITLPELEQLRIAHLATISSEMRIGMKPYAKVRAEENTHSHEPGPSFAWRCAPGRSSVLAA